VCGGWQGLKNGVASGLAAGCAKLLLQPFDTVKTIQQVTPTFMGAHTYRSFRIGGRVLAVPRSLDLVLHASLRVSVCISLSCPDPCTCPQASQGSLSMVEAGRALVRAKGVGALYSGLGVTLVGSIPAVSVYFGVYQASKKALL
jgi:hypothetical protein